MTSLFVCLMTLTSKLDLTIRDSGFERFLEISVCRRLSDGATLPTRPLNQKEGRKKEQPPWHPSRQ